MEAFNIQLKELLKMEDMLSKDEALENAIIMSLNNPRHCLYFKEKKSNMIAKTLINSGEIYHLDLTSEYERSVLVHEYIHFFSTTQTRFKRIILYETLANKYMKGTDFNFPDFHIMYELEVVPMLELFAVFYQVESPATPQDLKEHLINQTALKPSFLELMASLDEILDRMLEKCLNKNISRSDLFIVILRTIFSTPNIIKERIFDRFRVIRDAEQVPEWRKMSEIQLYLERILTKNGFIPCSDLPYGNS